MTNDTTEDAEQKQHEVFKRMRGEEKVRLSMAFSDFVRDLALAGLRSRHPAASESQQRVRFIKEVHGVEIRSLSGEQSNE